MNLIAQAAVAHVLNTLPEGLLLVTCAWLLLRVLPRQNSGTRFAIWMVALAGVMGLPFLGALRSGASAVLPPTHPEITLSPFWAVALLLLWIPVSLFAMARIVAGIWQVRRIRSTCNEVPWADLDPVLRELFADQKRRVRLLTSEQAKVPAAMGFRHPAVVLPAWVLRDLSTEQVRHILIHELTHLRRHDDWTNLVQKIARAVFFFHPAVWWIDARLSLEREMACDEAVLVATGNPRAYAGCLIDLLERGCARRGWTMAQAAVARARDASVRIARILHADRPASTRVGRRALGLAAGVSLACSAVVLCSPGLVEFAPIHSRISASALALRNADDEGLVPASTVVPAMYHPAQATTSGPVAHEQHQRRLATIREPKAPAHARLAVIQRKPENRVPVVLTSLNAASPRRLAATSAYWVIQSTAVRYVPTAAAVPDPRMGGIPTEDSMVQVQMVQCVEEDGAGMRVQVLRLVLRWPVVPQSGVAAQSI